MYSIMCLILVPAAVVYGKTNYVSVSPELLPNFINWSMDCIAKTGVEPDAMQKILSWNFEDTESVRKYIYCFAKSSGYADEYGHLIKDKMMKLVANHKMRNEFGDVIDECNKSKGSNKYETMYKTTVCFHEKSPILFKL